MPQDQEQLLPRTRVAEILATQDADCSSDSIGYYGSLDQLAQTVRSSGNWQMGEVFVHAESAERFIVMQQVAPSSCEMLTVSHNGYHEVLTAYRFDQAELVEMLRGYLAGAQPAAAQA